MGQVMTGQLVCRMHGGQEPNAKRAAKQRVAYQDAMSFASRIVAYDATDPETPAEGLLREVAWSAQVALALGSVVSEMVNNEGVVSVTSQGAKVNALVEAWTKERDMHAKLCKAALDAGIEQQIGRAHV